MPAQPHERHRQPRSQGKTTRFVIKHSTPTAARNCRVGRAVVRISERYSDRVLAQTHVFAVGGDPPEQLLLVRFLVQHVH